MSQRGKEREGREKRTVKEFFLEKADVKALREAKDRPAKPSF